MMRYLTYLFFLCCLAFSASWAYRVNYETRDVAKNLRALEIEIAEQTEKRIMLEGEWAYLNRPDRLSRLSEKFFSNLGLMPMSAHNFADIDAIRAQAPSKFEYPVPNSILDKANIHPGEHR